MISAYFAISLIIAFNFSPIRSKNKFCVTYCKMTLTIYSQFLNLVIK